MTETRCSVCFAATDAFACQRCADKLERAIAEMPALVAELEITATKQDRINTGGKRGKGDEAPLPFNWSASDQLWAIWNTLGTWARHLAEQRGAPVPSKAALMGWMLGAVQSIRMDEAAGEIYDEVIYAHAQAQRIIDRPEPDIYAGRCDAADVRVGAENGQLRPTVATCGADLYAKLDDATVKCQACGMEYDLAERKRWLLEQIPDVLATTVAIANALTSLLVPVTPAMIRQMKFRNQIVERGSDATGHDMFRVGDVMDVLELRARKLSDRRGRIAS